MQLKDLKGIFNRRIDPFAEADIPSDPCNPSPCGTNAECSNGVCNCRLDYVGNPYELCQPECVINDHCPSNRACIRNKCADPCAGTCGQNAVCDVFNHVPMCSCPPGMSGNAFVFCSILRGRYLAILWSRFAEQC